MVSCRFSLKPIQWLFRSHRNKMLKIWLCQEWWMKYNFPPLPFGCIPGFSSVSLSMYSKPNIWSIDPAVEKNRIKIWRSFSGPTVSTCFFHTIAMSNLRFGWHIRALWFVGGWYWKLDASLLFFGGAKWCKIMFCHGLSHFPVYPGQLYSYVYIYNMCIYNMYTYIYIYIYIYSKWPAGRFFCPHFCLREICDF